MSGQLKYLLIAALLFYLLPYCLVDQIFIPDEVDYRFFGQSLAEQGRVSFVSREDEQFGFKGFIPRHFTYNHTGEVVPQGFQGFMLLIAFFHLFLPSWLLFVINPLLAVLALFLFYRIAYGIFADNSSALCATSFLATTPVFVHWTNFYMPDILNATLFLGAILCAMNALYAQRLAAYMGLGVFSALLYWTRYTSVLLLVPLICLAMWRHQQLYIRQALLCIVLFTVTLLLALAYHAHVYGTAFERRDNSHIASFLTEPAGEETPPSLIPPFRLSTIWQRVKTAPAMFSVAYPPFVLGFLGLLMSWRQPTTKDFTIIFVSVFLVSFAFFANFHTHGLDVGDITVHSSFLRYLLPVFILMPLFTMILVHNVKDSMIPIVILINIINLLVAFSSPHGILESSMSKLYFRSVKQFILNNTHSKTVVASSYWDKLAYPDRITYGHINQISQSTFEALVDQVVSARFDIAYIDHKYNQQSISNLNKDRYKIRHIQGPPLETWLLRTLSRFLPSDLFPVNMYLISAPYQHRSSETIDTIPMARGNP